MQRFITASAISLILLANANTQSAEIHADSCYDNLTYSIETRVDVEHKYTSNDLVTTGHNAPYMNPDGSEIIINKFKKDRFPTLEELDQYTAELVSILIKLRKQLLYLRNNCPGPLDDEFSKYNSILSKANSIYVGCCNSVFTVFNSYVPLLHDKEVSALKIN